MIFKFQRTDEDKEVLMLKTPKGIKRDILNKFRSLSNESDTLSPRWLLNDYWRTLTVNEKSHFNRAVTELIQKGLVEKVTGRIPTLKLTDKGCNLIF